MNIHTPFSEPRYVMVKPVGSKCNLACDYCYYLEKERLYDDSSVEKMDDRMLDLFTKQYLEAQTQQEVLFTWHGGEPLLQPIAFYKKALMYQRKYGRGYSISNCIQTNGTLINDEWCRFLKDNHFLVGVSIDGTAEMHDRYRRNRNGRESHDRVLRGIELMRHHGVEFNIMAVVNNRNADYPIEFYRYLKQLGSPFIQFAPIVERLHHGNTKLLLALPDDDGTPSLAPFSVTPQQWGAFLCKLFDEWIKEDVGKVYIQLFDATLANWMGVAPGICTLSKTCGHAAVMEMNGDVYACDHYVFPDYKIGNIRTKTVTEMMLDPRQRNFGTDKRDSLPLQCKKCKWLFACNGECPKNRFVTTNEGEPGLNYLCEGYSMFFSYTAPYMEFMCGELKNQRPPANVMNWAKERQQ